jgi:prepilin-type N-terminal cleavage/methylation domain-containing protein
MKRFRHSVIRRRQAGFELGFTLIEVMITSALLLVVLAIVLPQLSTSITNFDNARVRSDASDAAQVAMDQIQHDVVSSNVLYIDAGGIVHLQVFGGSVSSSTTVVTAVPMSNCVEYQVSGGTLQRRSKLPAAATWPAGWSTVITGVVNSTQTGTPSVFSVTQNRSLAVTLWVKADTRTVNAANPSLFTTTVTGRAIPKNPSSTTGACA